MIRLDIGLERGSVLSLVRIEFHIEWALLATSIDSLSSSLTVPSSVEVFRKSILAHQLFLSRLTLRTQAHMLKTSCFFLASAMLMSVMIGIEIKIEEEEQEGGM